MAEETRATRVAGTGEVVTFSPKPFKASDSDEQEKVIGSLTFEVGTRSEAVEINDWPYTTEEPDEIEFLRSHPHVQEDSVEVQGPSASGAAQSLAAENGVDLARVEGTGKNGNITKEDVERHLAETDPGEDE